MALQALKHPLIFKTEHIMENSRKDKASVQELFLGSFIIDRKEITYNFTAKHMIH